MTSTHRIIPTQEGFVGIVATERGLRRLYLPEASRERLEHRILSEHPDSIEDVGLLPELSDALVHYFEGGHVELNVRLDWTGYPAFEVDVWRACRSIPYGQTRTYKDLAERLGRPDAARAVGMAMGRNPFPIVVPCHRVVKSDGSLGGYSGPGGVEFKRRLLEMEHAVCQPA